MAYQQKKGHAFKVRVPDDAGNAATLSTGTSDAIVAEQFQAMVRRFVALGPDYYDVRRHLVAKRVPLVDVFYHYNKGTLKQLLADLSTADLDEWVAKWEAAGANSKYVTQVRRFIPKGKRFPAANFRRATISQFLSGLVSDRKRKTERGRAVSGSTKNRYRAALSQLATFLVENEVIEHNPVRDVAGKSENDARELYLEREDAMALVTQQEQPYAAVEAFMANGIERSAVKALRRKDVDLSKLTINAHGSKTKWRNRTIPITELWTVPVIKAHIASMLPNALVFEGVRMDTVLDRHVRLQKRLKIRAVGGAGDALTTLHDWRHTFAVNALRDGMSPAGVAKILGHKDTSLVHKNYGRFIVDERDYITTAKRKSK